MCELLTTSLRNRPKCEINSWGNHDHRQSPIESHGRNESACDHECARLLLALDKEQQAAAISDTTDEPRELQERVVALTNQVSALEDHSDRIYGTCDVLAAAVGVTSSATALGD